MKASELLPNPRNWRRHPDAQAKAMRGALAEIGYADALIAYETPDGLMLIDGHLRAEMTPDMEVPVLVTDLNEEEAGKLLATLDRLAEMASSDRDTLQQLLDGLEFQDSAVTDMLRNMQEAIHVPYVVTGDYDFDKFASKSQEELDELSQELEEGWRKRREELEQGLIDMACPECGAAFAIDRHELLNQEKRLRQEQRHGILD